MILLVTRKEEIPLNERIKKLRKALDLTQQEFANRIGTTANVLTNYETGRRNPSSSVINNICKEFNVNETWLRTGEGEMLIQLSKDEEIAAFVGQALSTESDTFKKRFIVMLSKLDESDWEVLEKMTAKMEKD
jgi:transcriptional regulator with XRE-family HTH domain